MTRPLKTARVRAQFAAARAGRGPEWDDQHRDWVKTLAYKAPDVDPLDVVAHLLTHWPAGVIRYNAWWASGRAQQMGLVDEHLRPVERTGPPIDDEALRRRELLNLGGPDALAAYIRTTEERGSLTPAGAETLADAEHPDVENAAASEGAP